MNRPRVTLKLATSLDGRIATASGESRWITGEFARAEVHRMRAAHGAVMVGAETVRRDNPSLLARTNPPADKQPSRVVLSKRFNIPLGGRLFEGREQSPIIVIGAAANDASSRLAEAGAQIGCIVNEGPDVDVILALRCLQNHWGIESVFAEGGGKLAASLIQAGVVDRLEWFRAQLVLGAAGRPAIGDMVYEALAEAPRWRRVALRELGPDLWESYERA